MNEIPPSAENPFQSPLVTNYKPPVPKLQLAEGTIFVCWLVFFLVSLFGGLVMGALAGFIIGVVMAASGASMQTIVALGQIAGFLMGCVMSYVSFRLVLRSMVFPKIKVSE